MNPASLAWLISALATAGVIARPFGWREATWAVSGALLLVVFGLLPVHPALDAVAKGGDVYLFLTGMMLLSERARREGLFDWVAARDRSRLDTDCCLDGAARYRRRARANILSCVCGGCECQGGKRNAAAAENA
ncbi:hypothetical protein WT77_23495 [Burkholderia stagnalis]|nr:hypothetical protein WT77_23495 [Burkholderia stagnalis]